MLPVSVRRISFKRNGEEKGKEKKEAVDAGKQMCGICLSEDQRMTPQGMLNCCSHYFCFKCIMEWSKVESRCPLCKRRFTTITKSSKVDLGLELKKTVIRVEERDQVTVKLLLLFVFRWVTNSKHNSDKRSKHNCWIFLLSLCVSDLIYFWQTM
jgi:hypothetical protein